MRIPLLIAVAVIVLTPANIREVTLDAAAAMQAKVGEFLGRDSGKKVEIADANLRPSLGTLR